MKKIFLIIIIILIISIILLSNLFIHTPKEVYENTWGIYLPDSMEEKFHISSQQGFHGDGERYTIYQMRADNPKFIKKFSEEKNRMLEREILDIARQLEVPKKHQPKFKEKYLWKEYKKNNNQDILYIIYSPETQSLYFIQETS